MRSRGGVRAPLERRVGSGRSTEGKSPRSLSRSLRHSPERLVLPVIAWTSSCERASSSPLVSCNYHPSALLERDHLLLLHHQSSSLLPGVALSPENAANRADGASPEVPRCSLCSIRSKAAAPPADAPALRWGGLCWPWPRPQTGRARKREVGLVLLAMGSGSWGPHKALALPLHALPCPGAERSQAGAVGERQDVSGSHLGAGCPWEGRDWERTGTSAADV